MRSRHAVLLVGLLLVARQGCAEWQPRPGASPEPWCGRAHKSSQAWEKLGGFHRDGCCRADAAYAWPSGGEQQPPRLSNGSYAALLAPLRDKVLVFAGDSLTEQTVHSLRIGLQLEGEILVERQSSFEFTPGGVAAVAHCDTRFDTLETWCTPAAGAPAPGGGDDEGSGCSKYVCRCSVVRTTTVPRLNLTLHYLHFYHFGVPEAYLPEAVRQNAFGSKHAFYEFNTLDHRLFEDSVRAADAAIVNSDVYISIVRYISDTLAADMARDGRKRHAWRASFPVHFKNFTLTPPRGCLPLAERHWSDHTAVGVILGAVPILDMFPVMRDRGHWHSTQPKHDCMHWCFRWELWYPFWELVVAHVDGGGGAAAAAAAAARARPAGADGCPGFYLNNVAQVAPAAAGAG